MFLSKITSLGSSLFSKVWKGSLKNELTYKLSWRIRAWVIGPCITVGGSAGTSKGVMSSSLRHHRRLSQSVRHSALPGQRVARCHDVVDAEAVALNLVIHEFIERGGSIARYPHKFGCERGWCQHPLKPPCVRVVVEPPNLMPPRSAWLPLDTKHPKEDTKLLGSVRHTPGENSKIHIFTTESQMRE